jgi:hypothetical protein
MPSTDAVIRLATQRQIFRLRRPLGFCCKLFGLARMWHSRCQVSSINQSINKFMFTRRISGKVFGRRNKFFVDFFGGSAFMKPRCF